ncbi:hypothetical protein ACH3XW_7335 [Acanthocheilonema viteae]
MIVSFRNSLEINRMTKTMLSLITILCLITIPVSGQMLPLTIKLPLQKHQVYQDKVKLNETGPMKQSTYKDAFKPAHYQDYP